MKNDDLIRRRIALAQRRLAAARLLFAKKFHLDVLSSSYFAMLSATQALLASNEFQAREHCGVIALFNLHFVKTGLIDKQFNTILGRAREVREFSDYGDFYETTEQECRAQLQNAEQFVEMAINFLRAQGFEFTANDPFN
jgi:uncharacterized protein (UPF0332 family)